MRFDLTDPDLAHLLQWVQHGVVSRRQIEELGGRGSDIRRMVRRRELNAVHPGVYVNHTGELTRAQREWVAVQSAWPAALTNDSALPKPTSSAIHIAVHLGRTVVVPRFVVPHRTANLDDLVDWRAGPPTVQLEHIATEWSDRTGFPTPVGRRAAARPGTRPIRMSGTSSTAWSSS